MLNLRQSAGHIHHLLVSISFFLAQTWDWKQTECIR